MLTRPVRLEGDMGMPTDLRITCDASLTTDAVARGMPVLALSVAGVTDDGVSEDDRIPRTYAADPVAPAR